MACALLGYFVAFQNESLILTTVEVQTKSGYFAFDCILPLQAILPFNVYVSSKLGFLLSAHKYCFNVLILIVWIVILTMNKMARSSNLCRQGT